jgi:hypothetical protein
MKYVPAMGMGWQLTAPLHGNVIAFPEVAIDSADADVLAILRPVLNIAWNAFGFLECDVRFPEGSSGSQ